MNEKVVKHKAICDELNQLYARKNHDYGDSFHQTFVEEGMAMPRIRLGDKFSRFKTLTQSGGQQVTDESIRDTLLDLANYAIMTILEMEKDEYSMVKEIHKLYYNEGLTLVDIANRLKLSTKTVKDIIESGKGE